MHPVIAEFIEESYKSIKIRRGDHMLRFILRLYSLDVKGDKRVSHIARTLTKELYLSGEVRMRAFR